MAKNKVEIDVKADDKGSLKKVTLNSKKAGDSLNNMGRAAQTADRNLKGAAQASANGTKNFSKMSQGMGGLVAAYATLAAQVFAVSAAFNFLKSAGNLDTLRKGQIAYASSTGIGLRTLTKDIQAATDAQISFQDAAQAGAIGVAAGLSADQLTRLGKAARDSSIILGRDVTDSFNRLIRGVTKAEPELLDELGIILRLKDAQEAYGRSLGINANDLNQFQKSQAVANDVLAQAEEKYSRIIDIVDPGVNKFNQLGKAFDDIVNNIKELAVTVATPLANIFVEIPQLAYVAFAVVGRTVLTAALPALTTFNEEMNTTGKKHKEAYSIAKTELESYTKAMVAARKDSQALANMQKTAGTGAKDILKNLGVEKATGGQAALLSGDYEKLTNRQIAAMKRVAQKGQGVWADATDKARASFIKYLDDITFANKAAQSKIAVDTQIATSKIGLYYRKAAVAVQGSFALMARGAAIVGNAISKAFFWLQIGTLIFTVGKLVYDFFKKPQEPADELTTKTTFLESRLASLNEEFVHFVEIQKILTEDGAGTLNYFSSLGKMAGSLTTEMQIQSIKLLSAAADIKRSANIAEESAAGLDLISAMSEARNNTYVEVDLMAIRGNKDALMSLNKEAIAAARSKEALAEAEKAYERALERSNMGLFEYIIAEEGFSEAQKKSAEFLKKQLDSLNNLDEGQLKTSGSAIAYRKVLEDLNKGLKVTPQEVTKAREAFLEFSQTLDSLKRQTDANKKSYADYINSFVGQNTPSRLLKDLEKELGDIGKVLAEAQAGGGVADPQILKRQTELTKQQTFLNNILKQEFDIKKRTAILDIETAKRIKGATKDQAARVKIEQDIKKLAIEADTERLTISNLLAGAAEQGRVGYENLLVSEQRSLDLMYLKLMSIEEQNAALERQKNELAQIEDAAKNALEGSLKTNIAAVIKGEESSLKDAMLTIAQSVLGSVADKLSEIITGKVMDFIFPVENPAVQMKTAIIEGGRIAAADMGAAVAGQKIPGSTGALEEIKVTAKKLPMPTKPDEKGGWFDNLLGTGRGDIATMSKTGNLEEVSLNKSKGSLNNFLGSLGDIFDKNAEGGLVEKLGIAFEAGGNVFADLFGGLGSMFGDLLGGLFGGTGGGSGLLSMIGGFFGLGFMNGGYAKGGFRAFANGGMVTQPTLGLVGEGKMNEAIVPLPNGRAIPVDMKGAGQNNNVVVNVSVDNQGNGQTTMESQSGADAGNLGQAIARAVQQELQNQKRSGGILNPYGVS